MQNRNSYLGQYGQLETSPGQTDFSGGFLGGLGQMIGTIFAGDNHFFQNAVDELSGYNSQMREFAQQEYLLDKMNEYNDPSAQMARMKRAGINTYSAAQGISNGGNPSASVPSVNSASSAPAAGVSAAAAGISSLSNASLASAQRRDLNAAAEEKLASAHRTNILVEYEKRQIIADTAKALEEKGVAHETAIGLSIKNFFLSDQERADLLVKFGQWKKVEPEIDLMHAQKKKYIADARLQNASSKKYELENDWYENFELPWRENMMSKYHINPSDPAEVQMFDLALQGYDLSAIGDLFYQQSYSTNKGQQVAIDEYAFSISRKQNLAQVEADWLKSPTSIPNLVSKVGTKLGNMLREAIKSGVNDETLENIQKTNDFLQSYSDAKSELRRRKDDAYKHYKYAKRWYGQSAITEAYNKYQSALDAYEALDEDSYAQILLNASNSAK